jgi:hypothetical protein
VWSALFELAVAVVAAWLVWRFIASMLPRREQRTFDDASPPGSGFVIGGTDQRGLGKYLTVTRELD